MNELENLIKEINRFKAKFHFSMDFYYNDTDDTFVVRLSQIDYKKEVKHFRNKKAVDSYFNAYKYLYEIADR